ADHQYLHSFPTRRSSDLDRHVEEVSQIAHDIGSASTQQSAPLHRQCWCHVRSRPSRSAIKRVGDIKMPDAGEAALIGIAGRTSVRRSRSIESHGCSAVAPPTAAGKATFFTPYAAPTSYMFVQVLPLSLETATPALVPKFEKAK